MYCNFRCLCSLLKNSSSNSEEKKGQVAPRYYSSLVGMEVNKLRRGEGLSKKFVAIWLRLCLETNAYPRAAVMNKPLISYVLKSFNFMPQRGGSCVELIQLTKDEKSFYQKKLGYNPQFALYSSSDRSLQGLFSQRVLRTQNIAILNRSPSSSSQQRGTEIYLKTKFEHPCAISENAVEYDPPPSLQYNNKSGLETASTGCKNGTMKNEINMQRLLLDNQIHAVLKTKATDANATGQLEFFANKTLLSHAFFTSVANGGP